MATDDIRISIDKSDNSKMCRQSSNKFGQQFSKKIGLQISSPSPHIKIEVIEGELGNNICKPRTKSLEEDPNQLGQISLDSINWSFYKVPYPLRQVNETAYEPYVISIGPYHHGKKRLETMEVIKRNCFRRMIEENNVEPGKFVTVMKKLEKRVRELYEEVFDRFDSDTFVEMMVLDGCFIIVLLFEENDYLCKSLRKLKVEIEQEIYCDLLLLENQIPFFVLSEFCDVFNMSNVEKVAFPMKAFNKLSEVLLAKKKKKLSEVLRSSPSPTKFPEPNEIKHLLDLVHFCWQPSVRKRHDPEAEKGTETETEAKETKAQSWKFICSGTERKEKGPRKFIRCATELDEAGINFVNKGKELQDKDRKDKIGDEEKGKVSLFDIDFTDDGKLKIPTLRVVDNTERILRNFMAYEQIRKSLKPKYVCDYVTLMDNLINSGKDVQLLCNSGIIDNWLGDDEVVAQMFNKLRDFTYIPIEDDNFYYAEIFDNVNEHCKRRWNKWKAKLNKDYFNSPWAIISVVAAFVLLLLTLLQTIFSVLSYVHPK